MALWIVGLGLKSEDITAGTLKLLTSGARVVLRTGICGAAEFLDTIQISFETFDDRYESAEDFSVLSEEIAETVASMPGDVVYGVLDLRDETVGKLLKLRKDATVIPGVPVEGPLSAFALEPCVSLAASDISLASLEAGMATVIREITSVTLAGEIKLALMDCYPEEEPIWLMQGGEAPVQISLEDLDRQPGYDHRTACYIPAHRELLTLERPGWRELNQITEILRGPNGCPWDRAQTHEGLRRYVIEEAWEVSDAIEREDPDALCEELGDLLWQVSMHASVAQQYGEFTLEDVISGIARKMLYRHPHVFSRDTEKNIEVIWDKQKRAEKGVDSDVEMLKRVASGLPALLRAQKVLGKAEGYKLGMDPVRDGIADNSCHCPDTEEELGIQLLHLCEEARKKGLDAEHALKKAVDSFIATRG